MVMRSHQKFGFVQSPMVKETKAPPPVSASQKRSYRSLAEPLPGHVQREAREKAWARLLRLIKRKKEGGSCGELDSSDDAGSIEDENTA